MNNLQKLEAVKEYHDRMTWAEQIFIEKKANAEKTTYRMDPIKVKGSSFPRWNEEAIEQKIQAREEYEARAAEFLEKLMEAYSIANAAPENKWQKVIVCRYIEFLDWKQTAEKMGCSARNCMLLHDKAVKWLEKG